MFRYYYYYYYYFFFFGSFSGMLWLMLQKLGHVIGNLYCYNHLSSEPKFCQLGSEKRWLKSKLFWRKQPSLLMNQRKRIQVIIGKYSSRTFFVLTILKPKILQSYLYWFVTDCISFFSLLFFFFGGGIFRSTYKIRYVLRRQDDGSWRFCEGDIQTS